MAFGTKGQFDILREVAFGSIGASYAAIGSPLSVHARIISFYNSTNENVYISTDETNNMLRLSANTFQLFDFSTNKIRDDGLFFAEGTVFYVKYASGAPTSGDVWIEVVSATGGV